MKRTLLFATGFTFVLCFAGCGSKSTQGDIPALDVEAALDNRRTFDLSEIAQSIEFIPLDESVPVGEISNFMGLQPSNSGFYIVSNDLFSPVGHFDRTGKFISAIGRIGRGPDETVFIAGIAANGQTGDVYIDGGFQVVGLDAKGRGFARNDSLTTYGMLWHGDRLLVPANPSFFDENAYVGDSVPFIDLFDRDLKRTGSIYGPNLGQFNGSPAGVTPGGEYPASSPPFMSYNGGRLLVKQGRGDTLYHYSMGTLRPAYLLNLGSHTPPAEVFGADAAGEWNERYFSVDNVLEGDRYIIATANNRQQGEPLRRLVFDRRNLSGGFSATGGAEGKPGFFIDGVALTPMYIRDNRLVGYMQAFEIYAKNTSLITDPGLKSIAATLKEDGNPVIVVATLN